MKSHTVQRIEAHLDEFQLGYFVEEGNTYVVLDESTKSIDEAAKHLECSDRLVMFIQDAFLDLQSKLLMDLSDLQSQIDTLKKDKS